MSRRREEKKIKEAPGRGNSPFFDFLIFSFFSIFFAIKLAIQIALALCPNTLEDSPSLANELKPYL